MTEQPPSAQASWKALHATTPGRAHLLDGIPCQDAAGASVEPRPHLIVCDGRGSAPFSHFGSERAIHAFKALVRVQQDLLIRALDQGEGHGRAFSPGDAWRLFALSAWRALGAVQTSLATERGGVPADYEFTLAAAVVGKRRLGCLQVGDSVLVIAKGPCAGLVFPPDGEEAGSATWFVTPGISPRGLLRAGLFSAKNLHGIAGLTDGAASRLIAQRGQYPAQTFSPIFEDLSKDLLSRQTLHAFLNEEGWTSATGDDRGIALLAPASGRAESPSPVERPGDLAACSPDFHQQNRNLYTQRPHNTERTQTWPAEELSNSPAGKQRFSTKLCRALASPMFAWTAAMVFALAFFSQQAAINRHLEVRERDRHEAEEILSEIRKSIATTQSQLDILHLGSPFSMQPSNEENPTDQTPPALPSFIR